MSVKRRHLGKAPENAGKRQENSPNLTFLVISCIYFRIKTEFMIRIYFSHYSVTFICDFDLIMRISRHIL